MEGLKLPSAVAAITLLILYAFFDSPANAAADPSTVTVNITDLPAAAPSDEIRAEPYPGFYDLLGRCISKLTDECGRQVVSGFFSQENKLSGSCCMKLVAMGQECYRGIVTIDNTIWSECLKFSINGQRI